MARASRAGGPNFARVIHCAQGRASNLRGCKTNSSPWKAALQQSVRNLPALPQRRCINPDLSEFYRRKVTELAIALADPAIASPAREVVRSLIEKVSVRWEEGQAVTVFDGALTALIGLAQNAKGPALAGRVGIELSSLKLVAGTGNRRNLPELHCFV